MQVITTTFVLCNIEVYIVMNFGTDAKFKVSGKFYELSVRKGTIPLIMSSANIHVFHTFY